MLLLGGLIRALILQLQRSDELTSVQLHTDMFFTVKQGLMCKISGVFPLTIRLIQQINGVGVQIKYNGFFYLFNNRIIQLTLCCAF